MSNTLTCFSQLTGIKNIPGDYVDLASAISDLNASGVGSGGVTLNLLPGNPQLAIAGGYLITASGPISDQVIKSLNFKMNLFINENHIQNCAITGVASSTTMLGIVNYGNKNSFTSKGNIFNNNISSATTGGFIGIYNAGNVTSSLTNFKNQL